MLGLGVPWARVWRTHGTVNVTVTEMRMACKAFICC
jgi:hypothetical protein